MFTPSETESRAEYWPGCEYVWVGFAAVDVPPSPNVHAYVSVWPSGSDEPALEKLTASGAGPAVGFADRDRDRRLVAARIADPADLADAERAADVGVAEIDVVERSVGPFRQIHDVAVGAVGRIRRAVRS